MTRVNARVFHTLMALGLLACAACPVIEILCRTNDCIFRTGHDTETTLALTFMLVELAVASLKLIASVISNLLLRLGIQKLEPVSFIGMALGFVVPTASPPLPLRV